MIIGNPLVRQLWEKFGMQAVKFCTIGGSAVVLSSVLLYTFTEYGHLWYVYSNWIAVVLGQVFAFCGYKYWAFTVRKGQAAYTTQIQVCIQWLVWGCGLVISTCLIYSLTTYVHIWYLASSWVASGASGASNFFAHRYWTYRIK